MKLVLIVCKILNKFDGVHFFFKSGSSCTNKLQKEEFVNIKIQISIK